MDLPDHMTFQHFFFNTYIGYFLQALLFALAAGAGYGLLFLPFGILFPLSQKAPTWKRTVAAGLLSVAVIEMLQPVPGRAFGSNDVILNAFGILVSVSVFMGVKKLLRR